MVKTAKMKAAAKGTAKCQSKARAKKRSSSSAVADEQNDEVSHKDQVNFLIQMANTKDPTKLQLINHYKSLGRFDIEKKQMLEMWKRDKSCKWFVSYARTKGISKTSEATGFTGFGTKWLASSC